MQPVNRAVEAQKIRDLLADGIISEQEFAAANQRLFSPATSSTVPAPPTVKVRGRSSESVKIGVFMISNTLSLVVWFVPSLWAVNYVRDAGTSNRTPFFHPDFWEDSALISAALVTIIITAAMWFVSMVAISIFDKD